jgi:hypothetical protein
MEEVPREAGSQERGVLQDGSFTPGEGGGRLTVPIDENSGGS